MEHDLLFSRFVSEDRNEPPDIDVDFEHERREEVMQYIYERYGRHRAGIAATVIHYRQRSAIREVGKALGLTEDVTARLSGTVWGGWGGDELPEKRLAEAGLDPGDPRIEQLKELIDQLLNFPRHLSQHVGGFVLTEDRLDETVPIHHGGMEDRSFIEWDKDDIDALGLMKVDVLALGMLTCIRKSFDLMRLHGLGEHDLELDIKADDEAVYDMLCKGDSIGVFQVESRAQINMLPRLRPRSFTISSSRSRSSAPARSKADMVHPYLRRRNREEDGRFPFAGAASMGRRMSCTDVLGKTLGVPLFQEQAMRLAIVAAEFTPCRGQPAAPRHGDLPQCRHDRQLPTTRWSRAWWGAATNATSPSAASSRSRASAATAFRKATRCPSPGWSTSRPGSNAITRRCSPARC